MRIQHNIMAMNAYRNYSNNVSAMQKNLEKLSSGYKINRAGDDAAGLAISEKMRAQISGLEAAQKNAKDGISLVQTAEGALTEVHDMLNRMVTLATQSANGTYEDTTDRNQLQKEVNQLLDEINRIADSSNFNGIKLLDGSMDAGTNVSSVDGKFLVGGTAGSGVSVLPAVGDELGTKTVLHKGGAAADGDNAFGAEFHNLSITGDAGDTIKVTINDVVLTGTLQSSAVETPMTGEDIAAALAGDDSKIKFALADGSDYDATAFVVGGGTFKAEAGNTDYGVLFTQTDDAAVSTVAFDVKVEKGDDAAGGTPPTVGTPVNGKDEVTAGFEAGTKESKSVTGATTVDMSGDTIADVSGIKAITELDVGGVKVNLSGISVNDGADTADVIAAIKGAIDTAVSAANTTGAAQTTEGDTYNKIDNINVVADGDKGFKVTFDSTPQEYHEAAAAKGATVEVDFGTQTGADVIGSTVTVGDKTYEFVKTGGTAADGNTAVEVAEDDDAAALATEFAKVTPTGITGTAATSKVTFTTTATGADQTITASAQNTATDVAVTGDYNIKTTDQSLKASAVGTRLASTKFDLTAEMATEGSTIRIGDETYTIGKEVKISDLDPEDADYLTTVAQRLTDAAAKNTTYTVSQQGGTIHVVEQVDYTTGSQKYDLTTKEGIEASLGFTAATSTKGTGTGLTLQIGDTADSFNQLTVNIRDMHAKSLGLDGLDISNQTGAAEAIDKIKAAINMVSDVRGTLGATQNRLDHTINNLSVMTENIQDAESTIRDVDVAEEMMAYTKNSILIQSAQAMLAQANQIPQGVLQLLG